MYPLSRERSSVNSSIASASKDARMNDIIPTRRHKADYLVLIYTTILMLLGLIVIYAIGPQRANVLNMAYGSEYSGSYFSLNN